MITGRKLKWDSARERILGDKDDPMLAEIASFNRLVSTWAREAECRDEATIAGEAATVVATLARHALYNPPIRITPDLFSEAILGVRVGQ